MNRILIFICVVFLTGCATIKTGPITGKKYSAGFLDVDQYGLAGYNREVRLKDYLKKHPDTDQKIQNMILAGEVALGMSQDAAYASWGKPHDKNKSITPYGVIEMWIYKRCSAMVDFCADYQYLHYKNGVITGMSE